MSVSQRGLFWAPFIAEYSQELVRSREIVIFGTLLCTYWLQFVLAHMATQGSVAT
jgi:hypothetical protein